MLARNCQTFFQRFFLRRRTSAWAWSVWVLVVDRSSPGDPAFPWGRAGPAASRVSAGRALPYGEKSSTGQGGESGLLDAHVHRGTAGRGGRGGVLRPQEDRHGALL